MFACFGAGTPRHDDFAHDTVAEGTAEVEIALRRESLRVYSYFVRLNNGLSRGIAGSAGILPASSLGDKEAGKMPAVPAKCFVGQHGNLTK